MWPFRSRRAVPPLSLDLAIVSETGLVRDHNEDRGRCIRPADAATLEAKGVLVLVADGMGGHAAGEVASSAAAETVARAYYASPAEVPGALHEAFIRANAAIWNAGHADGADERAGMGTTCTALVLRGPSAWTAHIGDSRLYRLRAGRVEQLTTDHSVVSELVADGVLTPEEARHHDARNVITRALGIAPEAEVALGGPLAVETGDVFVLTSDGLHDLVEDAEIGDALAGERAHAAARALVALANARGGHDNVTVAVAVVGGERPAARETVEARR